MISASFGDSCRSRIAHGKPFSGDTVKIRLSGNRAVQHGIARNHIAVWLPAELRMRPNDDTSAGQTLADIIVRFTDQIQCNAMSQERTHRLTRRTLQLDMDRIVRQSVMSVTPCHLAG